MVRLDVCMGVPLHSQPFLIFVNLYAPFYNPCLYLTAPNPILLLFDLLTLRGPESRDALALRYGLSREELVDAFGSARDEWMEADFQGWLGANKFYEVRYGAARCCRLVGR